MRYYGIGLLEALMSNERLTNQLFDKRLQILSEIKDLGSILSILPRETATATTTATPTPHKERAMPKANRNKNAQPSTPASTGGGSPPTLGASQGSSTDPITSKMQQIESLAEILRRNKNELGVCLDRARALSPTHDQHYDAMEAVIAAQRNYIMSCQMVLGVCENP